MSDDSSGTWITGRSLSGIEIRRGTSGLSSSASGTRYTCATSAGFGASSIASPAHATTGVMMKREPDLFPQLAQRRALRALARVDPAAGQGPLTGVGTERRGAPGQEKASAPFVVREEHDGHRGGVATVRRDRLPLESAEIAPDSRPQRLVEPADLIGHARARRHPRPQPRTRAGVIRNMTRFDGMARPFQRRS